MNRRPAPPDFQPPPGAPAPNAGGNSRGESLPRNAAAARAADIDEPQLAISWERREHASPAFLRLYARIFADLALDGPSDVGAAPVEDEEP
jgi:hypothetical protein